MQAVILAAGKSTRTYPLTLTRPKALLPAGNRTILEHNLEQLRGLGTGIIDDIIIIIGYKGGMIRERIGNEYGGLRITYVEQGEQEGSGHALLQAEMLLKDKFLVMNGDDLYSREDILECLKHMYCVLVKEVEDTFRFGICSLEEDLVKGITEKPEHSDSNLANTGLYVLDREIFKIRLERTGRGEYELTDYITALAKDHEVRHVPVKGFWLPVAYPWNLLEANAFLLKSMKAEIQGEVEDNVAIKGNVVIGKGTIVKSGTCIEGPVVIGENCVIGPCAYLRPDTSIGDNCKIRAEVVDSIIMKDTIAKHHSYIGHSVIGEDVNIGAGTVTSDFRHDGKNHMTLVKGEKVDSGRRKLGSFMGDRVRTGINTSIYPGRKIWPGKSTLPGEVVKEDVITDRPVLSQDR